MRITGSMLWSNSGQISSAMWGSAMAGKAVQKNSVWQSKYAGKTGNYGSMYSGQTKNAANIWSASENLRSGAARLSAKKNTMFDIARNGGSRRGVLDQVKQMVSGYNSTIDGLGKNPTSLNSAYRKMLENTVSENSEELQSIGITVGKDRKLSIDESKFNSAAFDKIEKFLGPEGGFTSKVAAISESIGNNNMMNPYNSYLAMSSYGMGGLGSGSLWGFGNSGFSGNNSYLTALMNSRYSFWT